VNNVDVRGMDMSFDFKRVDLRERVFSKHFIENMKEFPK